MPLKKKNVLLNLAKSGNQKVDPKSLEPGTPTLVENAQFLKGGRVDKRNGYEPLGQVVDIDTFYSGWYFESGSLASSSRIDMTGSAPSIFFYFTLPTAKGEAWIAECVNITTNLLSLFIVDTAGVEWEIRFIKTGVFVDSIDYADVWEVTLELDDPTKYKFYKDGVKTDQTDFFNNFGTYQVTDFATYTTNNPNGFQKSKGYSLSAPFVNITGTEDHLLLRDQTDVYSYGEVSDQWENVGRFIPAESKMFSIDEAGTPTRNCDCVHVAGISYFVMTEITSLSAVTADVSVTAIDQQTGETLFAPVILRSGERGGAKITSLNGVPIVIYGFDVTGSASGVQSLFGFILGETGPVGTEILLVSDAYCPVSTDYVFISAGVWDLLSWKTDRLIVSYISTAKTDRLIRYYDETLTELTAPYDLQTLTPGGIADRLCLSASSDDIHFLVVWGLFVGGDFTMGRTIMNQDGSTTSLVSSLGTDRGSPDFEDSVYGITASPYNYEGADGVLVQSVRVIAPNQGRYGVYPLHVDQSLAAITTAFQNIYYIINVTRGIPYRGGLLQLWQRPEPDDTSFFLGIWSDDYGLSVVSQVLFGRAPDQVSIYTALGMGTNHISEIEEDKYLIGMTAQDLASQTPGAVAIELDFASKELFSSEPYGRSMLVAGTNLHTFDGHFFRELGFFNRPGKIFATQATPGGAVPVGTFSIVVVYEYTDRNGYLHRSAPSDAISIVVASAASIITLNIPTYQTSNLNPDEASDVAIIPYRTEANGSIYYREDYTFYRAPYGGEPELHENDVTTPRIAIELKRSDADLSVSGAIYTTGGEIPPAPIPPCKSISTWNSRLWAGASTRDEAVFPSKLNQINLMPEFTESLSILVQDKPGRTTGLIGLGDKLIMSKRGRLYYSYGSGPDNTGGGGTFAPFEEIQGVSGSVNAKSIAVNKAGVNYKSDKGIYTMSGDLQTVFSGAAYEDSTDEPILKTLTPIDSETLRYITASGILSYNTYFNTWSMDSSLTLAPIDAAIYNNTFYALSSTKILRENRSTWIDDTDSYDMSIETGWTSFTGLIGFQRFYKLFMVMDNLTPYTVTVSLAYDYGDYVDFTTFTDTTDSRIIIYPSKQKCEAFRVKIEVAPNAGTEQSLNINFIGAVIGTKVGLPNQLPVSQRIGVSTI